MNRADYIKLADFVTYASSLLEAERCSIFVYDEETSELWTTFADGIEQIVVDVHKGIVGKVFQTKKLIVENDVYHNPDFCQAVDKKSGFKTENIIAIPIFNAKESEVIGVLELLNKEGGFTAQDEKQMDFFAKFISIFIQNTSRK